MRSSHFLVYTRYGLVSRNTLHSLGVKVAKFEVCYMVKSPTVAKINALLAEKGISKKQFYKDCEITSASFSLWNTGKTNPTMKNLKIIAEYLGVSVADLLPEVKTLSQEFTKKEHPTDSEVLLSQLPESIQQLIQICLDRPELASALLNVAQQIEKAPTVQE